MSRAKRADIYLVDHGYAATREQAQAAIRAGHVSADGELVKKPAQKLRDDMQISYRAAHPFVSRGGVKLSAALDQFALSPKDCICLDIGASTGGFTEVLLQRGASRVYAIDVGHGQMSPKLAADPRVVLREGVNARDLARAHVPEPPQAIVADVSFISLKLALAPALFLAAERAWAVLLVKPQFEVGREKIGGGGIVRDEAARNAALADLAAWVVGQGWQVLGSIESPIAGADGNREFLLAATRA
jgi:23S rRNA (cytidine1920-2'-O)/16S rRNA (cytidine1409-2'-O)-methyltransferase